MIIGVEDCLLVNIYAPKSNPGNKMPVMVWIHGGSLITGSNRCSLERYVRDIFYTATSSDDLTNSLVRFNELNCRYSQTGPQHFMDRWVGARFNLGHDFHCHLTQLQNHCISGYC